MKLLSSQNADKMIEVAKLLIGYTDLSHVDHRGNNVLMHALANLSSNDTKGILMFVPPKGLIFALRHLVPILISTMIDQKLNSVIRKPNLDGMTALIYAVQLQEFSWIESLIPYSNVDQIYHRDKTVIFEADYDSAILRLLLPHCDIFHQYGGWNILKFNNFRYRLDHEADKDNLLEEYDNNIQREIKRRKISPYYKGNIVVKSRYVPTRGSIEDFYQQRAEKDHLETVELIKDQFRKNFYHLIWCHQHHDLNLGSYAPISQLIWSYLIS